MKSKRNYLNKSLCLTVLFFLAYGPTWVWMWDRWFEPGSYYGHGLLIPFVSAFLIWQNRDVLKVIEPQPNGWGMRLLLTGLVLHIMSSWLQVYFISAFSMLIVLPALALHFYGTKMVRQILFPIAFLIFMIPLPEVLITDISFKMKMFAAQIAAYLLNDHMRIPAIRVGSLIKMRNAYVMVDDVCSGLRSLISLTALGSIFAYWLKGAWWRKLILFLLTIPVAIITNVFRIVLLSFISEVWGPQYAVGFFHDLTGMLVFVLAFILLYIASREIE